jgi:hypothetical protein
VLFIFLSKLLLSYNSKVASACQQHVKNKSSTLQDLNELIEQINC